MLTRMLSTASMTATSAAVADANGEGIHALGELEIPGLEYLADQLGNQESSNPNQQGSTSHKNSQLPIASVVEEIVEAITPPPTDRSCARPPPLQPHTKFGSCRLARSSTGLVQPIFKRLASEDGGIHKRPSSNLHRRLEELQDHKFMRTARATESLEALGVTDRNFQDVLYMLEHEDDTC